jgi:hypothetical protein
MENQDYYTQETMDEKTPCHLELLDDDFFEQEQAENMDYLQKIRLTVNGIAC